MTLSKNRLQILAGVLKEAHEDDPEYYKKSWERVDEMVTKYRDLFTQAGFGDYMIDFSDADPDAIEVMGEALKKLYSQQKEQP